MRGRLKKGNLMRNTIEMVMGAVVLLIAAAFLWLAVSISDFKPANTITIEAVFSKVGGLRVGDEVRVSGVRVGRVSGLRLDPEVFDAYVVMAVERGVAIPDDSVVRIASSSLLGGSHIDLVPGNSDASIADGHVFYNTLDPVDLLDILGRAIFAGGEAGE